MSNVNGGFSSKMNWYLRDNVNTDSISVTKLVEFVKPPYDKEFWSAYKTLEKLISKDLFNVEKKSLLNSKKFNRLLLELYDISELEFNKVQQDILDLWEIDNLYSKERGNKIHKQFEDLFYKNSSNIKLERFGLGGKFTCVKDYSDLSIDYGVYPEYPMQINLNEDSLTLIGKPDLIIKCGNEITIIDHKSNKKIDLKSGFNSQTKSTAKLKFPLNTLDDCNYIHYTLLLSLYAYILQKLNPEFIIKDLILNHYDYNNKNTIYHCEYLKKEAETLIRFYVKQHKLDLSKLRRQPIIY